MGSGAAGHHADVSTGFGAREEEALQRDGSQDASVQVGEDGREVGGAEARRDGRECGGGGAAVDGGEEMAAVVEQDADGVEDAGDVLGHGRSLGGAIPWRIGRRGWMGRVRYVRCHMSCMLTGCRVVMQGIFSQLFL